MDRQQIVEELTSLLEGSGVKIRHEPLGGSGGALCRLKNERIFFIDTQGTAAEIAAACADAVAKEVDIETIYLRPEIREFIEKQADKKNRGAKNG